MSHHWPEKHRFNFHSQTYSLSMCFPNSTKHPGFLSLSHSIMPSSTWKDLPLAACEKARIYFSQELAEETKQFDPEVDAAEHVGLYLTDKVIFFLHDDRVCKH